jgi:rhamnosyltransferase
MSRISVVVPIRNGGTLFGHLAKTLAHTRDRHDLDVLIIDSGSDDGTLDVARDARFRVHCIAPSEFGHGRTRNLGVEMAQGEVVCFLTHDVLPCSPDWPLRFAEVLADPRVAGVYGRQVPRDASTMEMFFVALNYPSAPLRFDPRPDGHHPRPGRILFSNAFSALRRDAGLRIPFPDSIGYSEDLVWAHHVLAAGYSLAYEPTAEALHAHHYTRRGIFRRSYLIGQSLSAYGMAGGASMAESVRFLGTELSYFMRQGHTHRVPQLLAYEFMRWSGFHAGRLFGGDSARQRRAAGGGKLIADTFASDPRGGS